MATVYGFDLPKYYDTLNAIRDFEGDRSPEARRAYVEQNAPAGGFWDRLQALHDYYGAGEVQRDGAAGVNPNGVGRNFYNPYAGNGDDDAPAAPNYPPYQPSGGGEGDVSSWDRFTGRPNPYALGGGFVNRGQKPYGSLYRADPYPNGNKPSGSVGGTGDGGQLGGGATTRRSSFWDNWRK